MDNDIQILQNFRTRCNNLNIYNNHGYRSPGKPLLVLLAIGKCLRGEPRLIEYHKIEKDLKNLLIVYGRPQRAQHPEMPFWRLQKDKIWEIPCSNNLDVHRSGDVSAKRLRDEKYAGGFNKDCYNALQRNPSQAIMIAEELISRHLPSSLCIEVIFATLVSKSIDFKNLELFKPQISDLEFDYQRIAHRPRDPEFRNLVLDQYQFKCAVCEFGLEFPSKRYPGLEAAHIQWHCLEGPNILNNGVSLCSNHHSLFDRGAFTIEPSSYKIIFSNDFIRLNPNDSIHRVNNKPLKYIPNLEYRPSPKYLNWHRRNVFRDAAV